MLLKLFSCTAQLSTQLILRTNVNLQTLFVVILEPLEFHAQLNRA